MDRVDVWSLGLYLGLCVVWFVLIWRASRRGTARERASLRWGLLLPLGCAVVVGAVYSKGVASQRRCEASAVADLQAAYQGDQTVRVRTWAESRGRRNVPMLHPTVVLRGPSGEEVTQHYQCLRGQGILNPR